ncbi:MAG TPA: HAD family hydrolase [Anaerolineae bacterium]|nr:HAD family hydrolase [Anaerolineae bacterium]
MSRYEAVLFDMGYTLVYFEPKHAVILGEVLRSLGVERSEDEIRAALRAVWQEFFNEEATADFPPTEEYDAWMEAELQRFLLAQLGVKADEALRRAYAQRLEAWFRRPGVIRTYPEVREVLTTLREQGYRLGIISNWSWNLRDRVAQVGLTDFFELIWASAYAGCNKPHRCIFDQALAQMGLEAGRALYVGDSYRHDVVGARRAGMDAVLLDRDGTATEADCPVIGDLWGLFDLL